MMYISRSEDIEGEKFEVRKIAFIYQFWFWRNHRSGRELTTKLAPGNSIYKVYNGHERQELSRF